MRYRSTHLPAVWIPLAGAIALVLTAAADAVEIFVLKSGGRIRGEWVNRDESPRQKFVVRTEIGGHVSLDRDLVAKVIPLTTPELLYAKIRPTYPDTVEGHEKLAEWCLEHKLTGQRRDHLERIIELDPNHQPARTALGYRRVGGDWLTREEEMASRGMKLYAGRYRTVQEIEIWEEEKKSHLAQRDWHGKLKRWRDWLDSSKSLTAVQNIKGIRDPFAVDALSMYLENEEEHRDVKLLMIDALSQIESGAALKLLVDLSLDDRDQEVRLTCLDHIVNGNHHSAVTMYIVALRSKQNHRINRAAHALRQLDAKDAILPLIDALVTEHVFRVGGGNAGQTSASFSPNGGGGLSFGNRGPTVIKRKIANKEVLNALVVLSGGANFNYAPDNWKKWYAAQRRSESINARRD